MAANNNPLQSLLEQIPPPLRNRYFLVLAVFFAWMIFMDRHDFLTQWKLQKMVNKLEQDKAYYSKEIEAARQERLDLEVNKEKFAREQYYMKKPGEDVFIIVKEDEKNKKD
ncbi:MAG: hypothetical protein DHS20C18_33050 [Saprospiraceae bacterium]|nr:MAG: hypothetical protein DHS20C18_33050 [Saprospiraceae bacterium]